MGIINTALAKRAAKNSLVECFKLKKKEKVLIIYDKKKKNIAKIFFDAAKTINDNVKKIEIKEPKVNGEEPSSEVAKEMMRNDVVMLITSKSLSHTNARKNANKLGTRIASMPGITEEMMIRAMNVNYKKIKALSKKIGTALKKGKELRITTKLGTRFFCKIDYNTISEDYGDLSKKSSFDNLPTGETFFAPIYGSCFGRYIVDLSQAGIGKLRGKITVHVSKGFATTIEGRKEAKEFEQMLKKVKDKNAFNVAEVGIGTNYRAKITGNVLEDEKVVGTCHIALGNNYSFGGKVSVPIHVDGVIDAPTIIVDDKVLMKDGKFMI